MSNVIQILKIEMDCGHILNQRHEKTGKTNEIIAESTMPLPIPSSLLKQMLSYKSFYKIPKELIYALGFSQTSRPRFNISDSKEIPGTDPKDLNRLSHDTSQRNISKPDNSISKMTQLIKENDKINNITTIKNTDQSNGLNMPQLVADSEMGFPIDTKNATVTPENELIDLTDDQPNTDIDDEWEDIEPLLSAGPLPLLSAGPIKLSTSSPSYKKPTKFRTIYKTLCKLNRPIVKLLKFSSSKNGKKLLNNTRSKDKETSFELVRSELSGQAPVLPTSKSIDSLLPAPPSISLSLPSLLLPASPSPPLPSMDTDNLMDIDLATDILTDRSSSGNTNKKEKTAPPPPKETVNQKMSIERDKKTSFELVTSELSGQAPVLPTSKSIDSLLPAPPSLPLSLPSLLLLASPSPPLPSMDTDNLMDIDLATDILTDRSSSGNTNKKEKIAPPPPIETVNQKMSIERDKATYFESATSEFSGQAPVSPISKSIDSLLPAPPSISLSLLSQLPASPSPPLPSMDTDNLMHIDLATDILNDKDIQLFDDIDLGLIPMSTEQLHELELDLFDITLTAESVELSNYVDFGNAILLDNYVDNIINNDRVINSPHDNDFEINKYLNGTNERTRITNSNISNILDSEHGSSNLFNFNIDESILSTEDINSISTASTSLSIINSDDSMLLSTTNSSANDTADNHDGGNIILHKQQQSSSITLLPMPQQQTAPSLNTKVHLKPWTKTKSKKSPTIALKLLHEFCLFSLFKCMGDECTFTTNNSNIMTEHLKNHISQAAKSVGLFYGYSSFLECAYCSGSNQTIDQLVSHVIAEHSQDIYQCPYCFYRSCCDYYIITHFEQFHPTDERMILVCAGEKKVPDLMHISSLRRQFIKPIPCFDCKEIFFVLRNFVNHIQTAHQKESSFTCALCSILLQKNNALYHFSQSHHIDELQCIYCIFGGSRVECMQKHMANMHSSCLPYSVVREPDKRNLLTEKESVETGTHIICIADTVDPNVFHSSYYSSLINPTTTNSDPVIQKTSDLGKTHVHLQPNRVLAKESSISKIDSDISSVTSASKIRGRKRPSIKLGNQKETENIIKPVSEILSLEEDYYDGSDEEPLAKKFKIFNKNKKIYPKEIAPYSFYGMARDKINLNKMFAKINISGNDITITCKKLIKIFKLNVFVKCEKLNIDKYLYKKRK